MTEPSPPAARRTWTKHLPAIGFLVLAGWFYLRTVHYSAPAHVQVSSLEWVNLDGSPLPPETLQGKAILLNVWAPWCGPCRVEMPWLQRLHTEHSDLVVIGAEDDPAEYQTAQAFALRNGISYPNVRVSPSLRSSLGHVVSLPTTLYISRSGKVVHSVSGVIPEPLIRRFAADAIAAD